jgi:hypothetical protein
MATKSFYFKDAVPTGATLHRSLQDGGSAPTTATTGTGWIPGTNAIAQSCIQTGGTEYSRTGPNWGTTLQPSAAPSQTIGDCWRSENAISGIFANTSWTFAWGIRSVTAAYTGRIKLAVRVWKSADQNGTSATELTSGRVVSAATSANLSTSADTTVTCTWSSPGLVALANEYLFVNVGVEITAAGGGNTQDIDFRVGSAYTVTTPDFALGVAPGAGAIVYAGQQPTVLVSAPDIATFSDDFSAGAVDTGKWTVTADSGTSAAQASGQLQLTGPTSGNLGYVILRSVGNYNLTESAAYASCSQVGYTGTSNCDTTILGVEQNASNDLTWYVSGSFINARKKVATINTVVYTTTWSASTHRWVRIRHTGSTVYFDTAPDTAANPPGSGDWVNRWSETTPITITTVKPVMSIGAWASTAPNNVGTALWESVNSATTVSADLTTTPGAGAVVYAGTTPVPFVLDSKTTTPTAGAVAYAGQAPTLNLRIATASGPVVYAGVAPTEAVTAHVWTLPSVGAIAYAGAAPTEAVTAHQFTSPTAGAAAYAGQQPTPTLGSNVFTTPAAGALAYAGAVPVDVVTAHVFIPTSAGAVAYSGQVPTDVVTAHQFTSPTVGAVAYTGQVPVPVIPASFTTTPGAGAIVYTGYAPTPSELAIIGLTDNFDGAVIDTAKWNVTADAGTSAYQQDGRLKLKGPAASATGYVTLESVSTYDLTGKSAFVALRQIASRALFESVVETAPLSVTLDASNLLVWYISNGSLKARKRVSASNTDVYSVTYNTTTHRWFRIREAGGSIYFDTAPSTASNPPIETDWVNRHTESNPFALTAIKVSVSTGAWSGPTADSGVAHFDGFNTAATTTGVLWRSTFEANNFSEWTENEGGTVSVSLDGGAVPGTEAVMAVQSSIKHSGTYAASTAIEAEVGNANPKCALFRNTEPTEQGETETFYSFWFYNPVRIDIDEPFGWQMLTEWQHTGGGLVWNQIDILNRGGVAGGANYPTFVIHGSLGGGEYPADTGIDITVGSWNHMEARYKRGDGDGEFQAWLNGVEWVNETGLTLCGASDNATQWGLMNYGELHESASPTTIYYDDVAISTTRIGYSAGVITSPSVGAIVYAGQASTVAVTAHQVTQPAAGSVAYAGLAPTEIVTAHQVTHPNVGAIAYTGQVPVVNIAASQWTLPGAGSIAYTGAQPSESVTAHVFRSPGVGAVAYSGQNPAPQVTAHQWIIGIAGAVLYAGQQPVPVSGNNKVTQPTAGAVVYAGAAPSEAVTAHQWTRPTSGAIAYQGQAPQSGGSQSAAPSAGAVVYQGIAPTAVRTEHQRTLPSAGFVVYGGGIPQVVLQTDHIVLPGVGQIIYQGRAPHGTTYTEPAAGWIYAVRNRDWIDAVRDRDWIYEVNDRNWTR